MSAQQLPLLSAAHTNQQLFSDHYLDAILPGREDWRALAAEAEPVRARIAAILGAFTPSTIEAQTEQEVVRPVLDLLGHTYEVQPALSSPDGTKRPDYILYRDAVARDANKNKTLNEALLAPGGLAVADAKYWERPLDVALKGAGDPFSNKHPGFQIAFYIQQSGLAWGVLTNGKLWRLYHRDTAHKLDRFYEVDLPALVARGEVGAFLYFYAFFRRAAFTDAGGALGLDTLLAASRDYARGVGDTLKGQVYDALRHLAQGFLDYPGNRLTPDPATLKLRESAPYRETYSLHAIARDVANNLRQARQLLPMTATLWPRLTTLFSLINLGSPPLRIATFNGGLFDPDRHEFLASNTVGDARLQAAIDMLARVGGEFVDYRDLAERHLGTIYEGLLEFTLSPIPQEGDWTIALLNDRGQRHATGSYYTPDYIVQYIVDQAVGPVLREAVDGKTTEAEQIAAVLAVNVLDPAMGSGHFPVAAMEYIARFLVDLAATPDADPAGGHPAGETDLAYWKRRVAQNCIYGVDLNPLAVDLAKLSLWLATVAKDRPLSFLDHHLRAGNALVGARLDDLAVGERRPAVKQRVSARERRATAAGQAAMFEDDAFRRALSHAVDFMWLIEGTAGETIAEVKEQERVYGVLREELNRKYERLANLEAARHFGLDLDANTHELLTKHALGDTIAVPARFTGLLDQVDTVAAERRFFHWELEFPEVFFDRAGQPLGDAAGFDAVIGNPPYVRQEQMIPFKPYFADRYPESYHGVADLYVYFFDQGMRLLRQRARLSYICSNSWLQTNFAQPLRRLIRTETSLETLIDLGNNRTFVEAPDVCPSIFVIRKETPEANHTFACAIFARGEAPTLTFGTLAAKWMAITQGDQPDAGWQLEEEENRQLFAKLMASGKAFGDIAEGKIYRGVATGLNDAFVIDSTTRERLIQSDPSSAAIIKPLLQGEDLRPWYQEDGQRWLIFARRGIDIDAYPSVKAYLTQFRDRLEPRPRDWDEAVTWPGRKPGPYKWYEVQDSIDYFEAFNKQKLIWPDIAKIPRFSLAPPGWYTGNTVYFAPSNDSYLLGFLQSRVAWMLISRLCLHNKFRGGLWEYRLFTQFIARLPIPNASMPEREAIGALALAITDQAHARDDLITRTRRRILTDLGTPEKKLNQKLTAWWQLDFAAFRAELGKVFKRDIPVKDRDDWEDWLATRRADHERYTTEIVRLETELNARVYALFDLTTEEIAIIEASTKYRYGEV